MKPRGFSELKPPLSVDQALAEANRCLFCFDAPCTRACPTEIDVPGFIKKIATGNLRGSARTILSSNILGNSCARACPTDVLCEGACVLNDLHGQKPIAIGGLQRYATDPVVLDGQSDAPLFSPAPANGRKVAVVGGGPAGLGCAAELAQRGYTVTVFEANDKPGGLNTFGIAEYKLDQASALREVEWVCQLGIELRCGVRIGNDVAIDQLLSDYDAVFIGVGLGAVPMLGLENESAYGCRDALDFIRELKSSGAEEMSLTGKRVAVLGGGNTAIDAVTQSVRLGAECVYLVYRRGPEQMSAYRHEVQLAHLHGVEFVYWAKPVSVLGSDKVTGIRCEKTLLVNGELQTLHDASFDLEVDLVLRATGQAKRRDFLSAIDGLEIDSRGVVVTTDAGKTSHPKIWAGGDCANAGKEVVNAVAEGKAAAKDIDSALAAKGR